MWGMEQMPAALAPKRLNLGRHTNNKGQAQGPAPTLVFKKLDVLFCYYGKSPGAAAGVCGIGARRAPAPHLRHGGRLCGA
jgi:hypothetical protein